MTASPRRRPARARPGTGADRHPRARGAARRDLPGRAAPGRRLRGPGQPPARCLRQGRDRRVGHGTDAAEADGSAKGNGSEPDGPAGSAVSPAVAAVAPHRGRCRAGTGAGGHGRGGPGRPVRAGRPASPLPCCRRCRWRCGGGARSGCWPWWPPPRWARRSPERVVSCWSGGSILGDSYGRRCQEPSCRSILPQNMMSSGLCPRRGGVPVLPGREPPQPPRPPVPLGHERGGMGGVRAAAAGPGVAGRARRPPGQLVHARHRRRDPLPHPQRPGVAGAARGLPARGHRLLVGG